MLEHLGKGSIPVAVENKDNVQTLRCRRPGDDQDKDVLGTYLHFQRTSEHDISITLQGNFQTEHMLALYRDQTVLWSSMALYTYRIDADIACYLATHCESVVDDTQMPRDYTTLRTSDAEYKPTPATSGGLSVLFANRMFETIFTTCFPMQGGDPDPLVRSLTATQAMLGMMSGRHEDFPRVDLVVNQTEADIHYRRQRGGQTFDNGLTAKLDATDLMVEVRKHDVIKAWLQLTDK